MPQGRRRLSGAQIVVEYLVRQGVRYVAGIPGHGSWTLTDALLDCRDAITTVQVMHEQSAVHLADGFYRASGRPMLAFTSIGPGATNTVIGMATAYVDSTAVALFTGSTHTYMRGHGVLQELERRRPAVRPPPRLERNGLWAPRTDPDGRADGRASRVGRGSHSRARCARGARPAASRRGRCRAGGGVAGRGEAAGDRGRWRRDRRRRG